MSLVDGIPLFSVLPKFEQAKLVSDVTPLTFQPDQWAPFEPQTTVQLFVRQGYLDIGVQVSESWVSLVTMVTGDSISTTQLPHGPYPIGMRCRDNGDIVCMNYSHFNALLKEHPRLLEHFNQTILVKNEMMLRELARTKAMLISYASELWSAVDDQQSAFGEEELASAAIAPPAPMEISRPRDGPAKSSYLTYVTMVGTVIVGLLSGWISLRAGFPRPAAFSLAILVWAVGNWLFDLLPDHMVAMAAVGLCAMFAIVPAQVAFSGFASTTWILLLAMQGITQAVSKSGLLFRASLQMLHRLPPTYKGHVAALTLVGLLPAPFLPGVVGRQAMISRLGLELGLAMRLNKLSTAMAGLSMAAYVAGSGISFISMTGGSPSLLVYSSLPEASKATVTWGYWILAALPAAFVVVAISWFARAWLYKPEKDVVISQSTVLDQLSVLGPLSRQEWTTLLALGALVLGFITQPMTGLDPTWVALGGFLLLVAAGTLGTAELRKGIDWPFLLLVGALLGVGAVMEKTGLANSLVGVISPLILKSGATNSWILLPLIAAICIAVRGVIPAHSAVVLMSLILTPVATKMGYNPFILGLVMLITVNQFYVPQSNPAYLAAYAATDGQGFTHQQARPFAWVYALASFLAVVISIPFWLWLKVVPW